MAGNKKAGTVSKIAPGPSGRPLCREKEYKQLIIDNYIAIFKVDEKQEKSICIDSAISGKADVNERVELLYKITFKNDSQI